MEFLTGAVQKEDLGIAEILAGDYEGKNIKVKGAIHTIRDMGEVAFIVLRRRDGLVQCVYEPGKSQFSVDDLKEADTVEVCGTYKSLVVDRLSKNNLDQIDNCRRKNDAFLPVRR